MRGVAQAVARLADRCARAEEEYPRLAAPDGTVAVPIVDLRIALNALAAAARQGGDAKQAPGEAPQSGGDSRNAQRKAA